MQRGTSLKNKLTGKPKYEDDRGNRKWIHEKKQLVDNFVIYQAKYLGCTQVDSPRGIDVVKDAIKKIQFQRELKKSESGKKGSKLQKVEVWVSVDVIKIIASKTKEVITQKPLHRISYCADDHNDKKLFSFIAKEQESKVHNCYAFITEREAAEFTVTLGQAFDLAYKRYIAKGRQESKDNREVLDLKRQVEQAKAENEALRQKLSDSVNSESRRSESINSNGSESSLPAVTQESKPSLLVDFGDSSKLQNAQQQEEFDPFDRYLSDLAGKRGLGFNGAPDLQDRAPFQSPIQKNPSDNPFEAPQQSPSNPFDAFFTSEVASSTKEEESQVHQPLSNIPSTAGNPTPAFLLTPLSKQSIKAANAMKLKPGKSNVPEQRSESTADSNGTAEPTTLSQDLFGISQDPSINSLEQSLGAGFQFDSFNFDPLQ